MQEDFSPLHRLSTGRPTMAEWLPVPALGPDCFRPFPAAFDGAH